MIRPNVIREQPTRRELGTQLVKIGRGYQIRNVSTDIRVDKQQTTASKPRRGRGDRRRERIFSGLRLSALFEAAEHILEAKVWRYRI